MRAVATIAVLVILFSPPNAQAEKKRKQRAPEKTCGSTFCIEGLHMSGCGQSLQSWCVTGALVNGSQPIANLMMTFTGIDRDGAIIGEYPLFYFSVIGANERWKFQSNAINGGGISRVQVQAHTQNGVVNDLIPFRPMFWNLWDARHWRKNHPDQQ